MGRWRRYRLSDRRFDVDVFDCSLTETADSATLFDGRLSADFHSLGSAQPEEIFVIGPNERPSTGPICFASPRLHPTYYRHGHAGVFAFDEVRSSSDFVSDRNDSHL
jgi:hypothetical protein